MPCPLKISIRQYVYLIFQDHHYSYNRAFFNELQISISECGFFVMGKIA
jgi:hypothetical protein